MPDRNDTRFVDLGLIACGGMGEVRRARDTRLDRDVAVKSVLPALADHEGYFARIQSEAWITARLQHPGVLCVIDAGVLPDGRFWYAMPLVEGETLTVEIAAIHQRVTQANLHGQLHQLVSYFLRICEVMAFAHDRRIIHRDLKPSNVMIGRFGEVFVMDWGIAKALDEDEAAPPIVGGERPVTSTGAGLTTYGQAMGTPAYMAPEQAAGALERVDRRSDVYSLGAILHEMLTGHPPWPPTLCVNLEPLRPDAALVRICESAMAADPAERPVDAAALSTDVRAWLDGAQRRAAALTHVESAHRLARGVATRRARAATLRHEGALALQRIDSFAPETEKIQGWRLEDAAASLERQARVEAVGAEQALRVALMLAPDLEQARRMLAEIHRDRLVAAELARDADAAAEAEALLRANDPGIHAEWLHGDASLTLATEPACAEVYQSAWIERDRRLVAEGRRFIGLTPLVGAVLPRGSHLLEIQHAGFETVRLPVQAERLAVLEWRCPGSIDDRALPLVPEGTLGPDDVYVPAGPFIYGGDPETAEPLPRRSIWVDGFIVRRHPVTVGEILVWLNELVEQGRGAEAELHAPTLPPLAVGDASILQIPRDPRGIRVLPPALSHLARWPVAQIDWHAAMAYADWLAARTGRPWRLLHEVEREKAARGVDGRIMPWGDFPEPTWCRNARSDAGGPLPVAVEACVRDESPYGVRGMAGNVRDWCLNVWTADGGVDSTGVLRLRRPEPEDGSYRAVRGGAWNASIQQARVAERFVGWPGQRYGTTGFRLGFSLGESAEN